MSLREYAFNFDSRFYKQAYAYECHYNQSSFQKNIQVRREDPEIDFKKLFRFTTESVSWLSEHFLGNGEETRGFQTRVAEDIGVSQGTVSLTVKHVAQKITEKAVVWIKWMLPILFFPWDVSGLTVEIDHAISIRSLHQRGSTSTDPISLVRGCQKVLDSSQSIIFTHFLQSRHLTCIPIVELSSQHCERMDVASSKQNLNIWNTALKKRNMKINVNKSKTMTVTRQHKATNLQLVGRRRNI
nr:unnamed protein product [Callosobruchus chinensis]